jgi:hypothetical protein
MLDTRFPSPEARAKYWVQWVTEFDYNNHVTQVLGYCVRSNKETLFKHKDYEVCEKVCDMLNENEEGA